MTIPEAAQLGIQAGAMGPVSCTVRVTAGEPVLIRDAVQVAMKRRVELFSLAKTAWAPGEWASSTWPSSTSPCGAPSR